MTKEENADRLRLKQIPVIYIQGTHSAVGYAIGLQFRSLIEDLLKKWNFFNQVIIPLYQTVEGKTIYDNSLALCTEKFPHYIQELQGMAEGAQVPFYKLFLLHIDSLIAPSDATEDCNKIGQPSGSSSVCLKRGESGCTTVMCDNDNGVIMGHTEDACQEFLNNVYIVSAEIVNEKNEKLEKFTTLTYAGHLPGYTMGYNEHGLIYTVNTIFLKKTYPTKTPRAFLARALLGASNFDEVLEILQDSKHGTSDGFSLNIHFAKQEGCPVLHNVEVGPSAKGEETSGGSEMSVLTLTHGECHVHCNKYLRLKIPEQTGLGFESSTRRHKAIGKHLKPNNMERIKEILSDESDADYPVFRCGNKPDFAKTVTLGIFDVSKRQWLIYVEPPSKSNPIAVLPLDF